MTRIFALIAIVCLPLCLLAKATYIPTYDNRLLIIENGEVDSLTNNAHALVMTSHDGLITCTLDQQVVSQELVRDINRARNAAGWAFAAAALSSFSEGMAQNKMNKGRNKGKAMQDYVNAHENTNASLAAREEAKEQAEDLKTLLLDLVVKNNSHKEMLITDMDRGLVWFVLPACEARLPLLKDEDCHFRISSCNPLDENVKYINARGNNTLEKYTIGLETDMYWYVQLNKKTAAALQFTTDLKEGYIRIDKETMDMRAITLDEFKDIKAAN